MHSLCAHLWNTYNKTIYIVQVYRKTMKIYKGVHIKTIDHIKIKANRKITML